MPTESDKLILLEDISRIVVSSHDLHETLDHITALLAERMNVEVCSIYLAEEGRLRLGSTHGLAPSAVGTVSMAPEEGLTGLAFKTAEPVNVERANRHPRYKFFPGIGEESFASYLGAPLIYRKRSIGVLTVQTSEPRRFSPDEVRLLVTAASQLSTVIVNSRFLSRQAGAAPEAPRPLPGAPTFIRGLGVSPGVTRGVAYPLVEEIGLDGYAGPPSGNPTIELKLFDTALERSIEDVIEIREQVNEALSKEDGAIFHAHLMILEDRGLQDKVRTRVREGTAAARAVSEVAKAYIDAFLRIDDPYLRERAADVRDVATRLLRHLRHDDPDADPLVFRQPTVVVAQDLTPSQFVRMIQPNLAGVALARGGSNSHTIILCRSAGIPAVVGFDAGTVPVEPDQPVLLDGTAGLLHLSPAQPVIREYERLAEDSRRLNAELRTHLAEPAATRDRRTIRLLGNAALLSDIPKIIEAGGEGVGLYRTEFPFIIRSSFPDEDEQVEIYAKIIEALAGRTATLRTLDVGGDKTLPYLPIPQQENPHLGWRSIRVSLEVEEPFRMQIRALLRASALGPVRIVFPMISTAEELRTARAILDEERAGLVSRGVEIPSVPVGAMVEVPSAALSIDRLAPWVDFFSIGTNDLVQYLLAVDRANPRVAHLYDPLHPSVLELIARVVETARAADRSVAVCGEMASRVLGTAALLAVGVEEFSVNPGALPRVRRLIQTVSAKKLQALAPLLRVAQGAKEVRRLLRDELRSQGVPETLLVAGAEIALPSSAGETAPVPGVASF